MKTILRKKSSKQKLILSGTRQLIKQEKPSKKKKNLYPKKERVLFYYWVNKYSKLTEKWRLKQPNGNSRDKKFNNRNETFLDKINSKCEIAKESSN